MLFYVSNHYVNCMKYKSGLLAGLISLAAVLQAQIINKTPLSERITGYTIRAVLDADAKTVSCTMEAFWVNRSADPVPDIQMHLYMNAFKSSRTTFYRERGGSPGSGELDRGWIDITSFTDGNGNDLLSLMEFISPDDGNTEDRTVFRVILPEPAMPGDTVFIKTGFVTKLPSRIIRTGFSGDFFFVAQWFPKFGVYEPAGMRFAASGGWNCHQFHANSEFYSNHSVYDVEITLPARFITGSGGLLMSETTAGDLKTVIYRAEDIVDFAWTAWPGYSVVNDRWRNVDITLMLPHDWIKQVDRQLTAVKNALGYLDENVGPYPWPHLTFVDPPAIGAGAGGMEYTTFFTSSSSYFVPSFFYLPEMVTVHEFGHAYFMGILASNEFEEPWLDEGVNSYWEQRIMDHFYGKNSGMINHRLFKLSDIAMGRMNYTRFPSRQASSNAEFSWNYPHGTYGIITYSKAATILHTLEGIIGTETMNNVFREYYRKWAFRHPSGRDFINVVSEVVRKEHGLKFGPDMNWFFDQTIYGTGVCDYKISDILNRRITKPEGPADLSDGASASVDTTGPQYTSIARLERVGELKLPVEVLIHFNNGDEIFETWDGKARYRDYEYQGSRKIEWVKIDPEYKNKMDVNLVNNSMTTIPERTPLRRIAGRIASFTLFFLSIMLL